MATPYGSNEKITSISLTQFPSTSDDNAPEPRPTPPPDRAPRYGAWQLAVIVTSLVLGTFLVALDTTILGTAVPAITTEFRSLGDIAWYGSGYMLTLTALQPGFGRLYCLLDGKWTYLACILVFEAGSILCATAKSSPVFIGGRAVAGVGAAGLVQGALAIVTQSVSLERRPFYLSIVASVFALSAFVGPVLGGVFTDKLSWRWCFWINVPIGSAVMVLIFAVLRVHKNSKQEAFRQMNKRQKLMRLDPLGVITALGAITCALLALQWGGQSKAWNSSTVVGLLVGFVLLFGVFWIIQWHGGEYASLPVSVHRKRSIWSGAGFLFFMAMPAYVYGFFLPIYFQSIKGSSASKSGVEFMTLAIPQSVFAIIAGGLATKFGFYTPYMIVGTAIGVVSAGLLTTLTITTTVAHWATLVVLFGCGSGLAINVPYTAIQVVLKDDDVPTGNAIAQFWFQIGAALSLCIGQNIFLNRLTSEVRTHIPEISPQSVIAAGAGNLTGVTTSSEMLHRLREAYMIAIRQAFIFAAVSVAMSLLFALFMEHKNVKVEAKKRKEETIDDAGEQFFKQPLQI